MTRTLITAAILCLAQPGLVLAAESGMATPASSPADQQDMLRQAAEKACNDALDHDRFNYGTMEECVADTMAKQQHPHAK